MDEFRLILKDWLQSRDLQIVLLACLGMCFAGWAAIDVWQNGRLTYARKMLWMGLMGVLMLAFIMAIVVAVGR